MWGGVGCACVCVYRWYSGGAAGAALLPSFCSSLHTPQVKVAMETVQNPARYNELLKGPKSRPAAGANAEGTKGQSLSHVSQSVS